MQLQRGPLGDGGSWLVTIMIHVLFHSTYKHIFPCDVQGTVYAAGPTTHLPQRGPGAGWAGASTPRRGAIWFFSGWSSEGWGWGSFVYFPGLAKCNHSEVPV